MQFSIEGTTISTDSRDKFYFHIRETDNNLYEIKIFNSEVLIPLDSFTDESIYLAFRYIASSFKGIIQFNYGSIKYLDENPLSIRDLVEEHKHYLV